MRAPLGGALRGGDCEELLAVQLAIQRGLLQRQTYIHGSGEAEGRPHLLEMHRLGQRFLALQGFRIGGSGAQGQREVMPAGKRGQAGEAREHLVEFEDA